jgi:hypothetical protein
MNIEEALKQITGLTPKEYIEKAIEGGFKPEKLNHEFEWDDTGTTDNYQIDLKHTLIDPSSWKAVGKAMGWQSDIDVRLFTEWKDKMHQFIDNLIEQDDER